MTLRWRDVLSVMAATMALPATSSCVAAQAYPAHPVTVVVGYPAGGPTDTIARIMADGMRSTLRQPLIVQNISGAAGTIAGSKVAHAAPDGYTLNLGNFGDHVIAGAVYPLGYHVVDDFEPVSLVSTQPYLIVAKKSMPASDLRELIAWLRANSSKATQGTLGPGSIHHVAGILFQKMTGVSYQFVPYRGSAPAMQDLLSEQIDFMIDPAPNSLPQVRVGAVRAYAVAAKNRLAAEPEIPTVDEAGLPGFYIGSWHAMWAPKGTSKDVIDKIDTAIVAALDDPIVRRRLEDVGQQIFSRTQLGPDALGSLQRAEIEKWWPIIKAAGIKAE
jgi:tripartite-type tricarboxylate transporter receptor subunit TctC